MNNYDFDSDFYVGLIIKLNKITVRVSKLETVEKFCNLTFLQKLSGGDNFFIDTFDIYFIEPTINDDLKQIK